ncbi:ABC transporter permease [Alkaliphilus peptidifermentans]|uniref:Sodium transport system permease protein n=1 Tax=Alkaliphilus peptidifermentans DSM 18978 TaxID=1120976 RepID=A0A1G5L080_9FIRM|nr:ABC transporter permease [Alkaliphilus peptidifermentans]SCZ05589.1 sodium transport system permease protein [Alkaliphilus peptidifermentans DSM 18978]
MNFRHVWVVFKKELKDIFRDKRTWIASVLIPVMVFPLMFLFMDMGRSKLERNLQEDISVVIALGEATELADHIRSASGLKVINEVEPIAALQAGKIKAIIEIEENFQEKLHQQIPGEVKIIFDEVSSESSMSVSIVERVIYDFSEMVRLERLKDLDINPDRLQPTAITIQAFVPEGKESTGGMELMLISFLLPFLLMMYPVIGGMPAAIDLGAGEKERMSLEPLLSTSADRLSILAGKYLTILLASIIGVVTSLIGIFAAATISPDMLPIGVRISPISMIILIGTSLSIAMILSGIMLSISVFAKSYKEAGTYLSPITILLMAPAYLTMFMDVRTLSDVMFFVPLLNSILLMKEVLVDIINPLHIITTFGISLVLVVLALLLTKYMFNKESVIFRS